MWNYNLDEMPKDGSKIVGFFKHNDYESTAVFYYAATDWKRESYITPLSIQYLQCWTYAPKKPTELLVDWFDQVCPEAASSYGATYLEGLKAIKERIEFKLAQHGRQQPEMAESPGLFPKAKPRPCFSCSLPYQGNGKAACTACGKLREKMAVSDEKVAEKTCPFHKIKLQGSYCTECQGWIIG